MLEAGKTATWYPNCHDKARQLDFETGQMVIHKRKAWAGLIMTSWINRHHKIFIGTFINDDKQTFAYAFNTTGTPYFQVDKHPYGIGRKITYDNGTEFMCASSMGQRHPVTGEVMFVHRNQAKFTWAPLITQFEHPLMLWTHVGKMVRACVKCHVCSSDRAMCLLTSYINITAYITASILRVPKTMHAIQDPYGSWIPMDHSVAPPGLFFPEPQIQAGCFFPDEPHSIEPVAAHVSTWLWTVRTVTSRRSRLPSWRLRCTHTPGS